ncbi:efflux RND transporter periplasmic adaptor subunit [Actinoplanes sp. NPDC026619]|uniref:efflux RND transporter periplasmic adaptor subunit n=1 Tax=Actinoplanes sp. NPDC026619 TaxID=3155798 RepID=UPI0033DAB512
MHPTADQTEVIPLAPDPPPRRGRTAKWLAAGVVAIVLGAGAAVVVIRHRSAGEPVAEPTTAVETVALERRDLSTTRKLDGTIGFGTPRPLAGHTDATVTWLPAVGATIKRGRQLFRADDKPVMLFYGSMPLYRPIAGKNLTGRDVRIIAENLRALGYDFGRLPVEDGASVLTDGLIAAVKRWQKDVGRPVTGTIAVGDVEVLPGAVRVDSIAALPGSPANAALMSVTSTRKVITVSAELSEAAAVERGDAVTVTLPDDRTVKARILAVGRTVTTADGGVADGPPKLTVSVTVDDPATIAKLDSAAVRVNIAGKTVKGALAAPIEALIALTEGGYAVQGPDGLVAVQTGMFADGWVQISGDGLTEGLTVVVAS